MHVGFSIANRLIDGNDSRIFLRKTCESKMKTARLKLVLHGAISFATYVAMALRDKLQVGCSGYDAFFQLVSQLYWACNHCTK